MGAVSLALSAISKVPFTVLSSSNSCPVNAALVVVTCEGGLLGSHPITWTGYCPRSPGWSLGILTSCVPVTSCEVFTFRKHTDLLMSRPAIKESQDSLVSMNFWFVACSGLGSHMTLKPLENKSLLAIFDIMLPWLKSPICPLAIRHSRDWPLRIEI